MGIFGKGRATPREVGYEEQLTGLVFGHLENFECLADLGAQASQFDPEATKNFLASGLKTEDIGAALLAGWIKEHFDLKPNETMWKFAYGSTRTHAGREVVRGGKAWGHVHDVLTAIETARGWTFHKR